MSQQETHIGKLIKIDKCKETSVEEWCKEYCIENKNYKEDYYDTYEEYFRDEYYDEFVIVDDNIYKIIENKRYTDIFKANKNELGQIEYVLNYYNGGCGFSEAIEYAIRNMNN